MDDPRRYAPAAVRNRDAILAVLEPVLAQRELVLEIASGSGKMRHVFAAALPEVVFQPSDLSEENRASIDAWTAHAGLSNVHPAMALDAAAQTWPVCAVDAVLCLNMIHISPWSATLGLLRNSAQALAPGGHLFLYGPFRRGGRHTAPSNAAFDLDLRARNPGWGIRDLETVAAEAAKAGFGVPQIVQMPVNNLSVVFRSERSG
jgi:SAM-dependent methyltransferase